MLSLDKNKFDFQLYDKVDELGYIGKIIHPDMKDLIFIKSMPHEKFEKYNLSYMHLASPTTKTVEQGINIFDDLLKKLDNSDEGKKDSHKKIMADLIKSIYFIEIDEKTIGKLRNRDKTSIHYLYHELGHYMHSDEIYLEKSEDRENVILSGRVLKQETDADEFALSIFDEDYYNTIRAQQMQMCKIMEKDNDPIFLLDAFESKLRAEHLAEIIIMKRK